MILDWQVSETDSIPKSAGVPAHSQSLLHLI